MELLVSMLIMGFGLMWLSLSVYLLHTLGKSLARRLRSKVGLEIVGLTLCVVAILISTPALMIPGAHPIIRMTLAMCVWLLLCPPVFMGYWGECVKLQAQDAARWAENADIWIGQWESEQAPTWARELMEGGDST